MKKKAVLRLSMYAPNDEGHGGIKRTGQINEYLISNDFTIFDLAELSCPKKYIEKIKYSLIGIKILIEHGRFKFRKSKFREGQHIGYTQYTIENQLKEIELKYNISSFIWEYTWGKYWYIPLLIKANGLKIIALPHNLESLVYSQKSFKEPSQISPSWFDEEIEYLSWCDEIFVISREEQWLLSLMLKNKEVNFLPYFSTNKTQKDLLRIRELRTKVKKTNHITVLGSAVNPPTLKGLHQLMEYIKNENLEKFHFDFIGFGMSKLLNKNDKMPNNIKVYDGVSKSVLEDKLLSTQCVLIYQIPSTGALTKIQELQIAGIPIIVNCHGARSYFNKKGVLVFEKINELKNKLTEVSEIETSDIPILNMGITENFINEVNNENKNE